MQAPDEQVDPVGHYHIVSNDRLGNKNIVLTYCVAAFAAVTIVRLEVWTGTVAQGLSTVVTHAGTSGAR